MNLFKNNFKYIFKFSIKRIKINLLNNEEYVRLYYKNASFLESNISFIFFFLYFNIFKK